MEDIISGIFLLLSIILANYIDPTMGKRINNVFKKNYALKIIILYLIIYFTIQFKGDIKHFYQHFIDTTLVFIFFIMLTKINIYMVFILFILILIYYILYKHIIFLNLDKEKNQNDIINYQFYNDNLKKIIIIITVISFIYEIFNKKRIIKYVFSEN